MRRFIKVCAAVMLAVTVVVGLYQPNATAAFPVVTNAELQQSNVGQFQGHQPVVNIPIQDAGGNNCSVHYHLNDLNQDTRVAQSFTATFSQFNAPNHNMVHHYTINGPRPIGNWQGVAGAPLGAGACSPAALSQRAQQKFLQITRLGIP